MRREKYGVVGGGGGPAGEEEEEAIGRGIEAVVEWVAAGGTALKLLGVARCWAGVDRWSPLDTAVV